jgi:ribosomal protein L16 Arg81 hydroxylase
MTMFAPAASPLLTNGSAVVDLDAPDELLFPRWRDARPAFDEVLHPGDAVYIPAGWLHCAVALETSVSITWNFVHESHREPFDAFMRSGGEDDQVIRYFGVTTSA